MKKKDLPIPSHLTIWLSCEPPYSSFFSPYPEVVIGFEETVYPAMEGEEVTVCVVLVSGELERDVVVRVSSADGTATGECSARFG